MKQNLVSRDLLLLAAVAFHKQLFDKAGSLFAAAMQSADVQELLQELDPEGTVSASIQIHTPAGVANEAQQVGCADDAPRVGLSAIAQTIGDAMSFVSNSADGDDSEDEEDEDDEDSASNNDPAEGSEDSEPEDQDDDEQDVTGPDNEDFDPDAAGQKVVPSSLSSAAHQGGGVGQVKIKLVMGSVRSPVRVK